MLYSRQGNLCVCVGLGGLRGVDGGGGGSSFCL